MSPEVIIGLLSLTGTLIGTFGGILASNKLTNYKIEVLSQRVDKHNNLIERMFKAEEEIELIKQKLKS